MARTGALDEMTLEAGSRPQRPYVRIGVVLLTLIFVVVSAAILLDKQLRPQAGMEPVSGTSSAGEAGPLPSRMITNESEIGLLATPLQREVAQAYLHYWAVYGSAMEAVDTAHLPEVAAGGRLQEALEEVEELRAEGVAAKIQVKHSFSLIDVTQDRASIRGEYINSSYAVDPATRRPVGGPGQSQHVVNIYDLQRIDGIWKVVGGVRGAS
jgi:hypothetical protein